MSSGHALIDVRHLTKKFVEKGFFGNTRGVVTAVDDMSVAIERGRTLGLVGESGCGKSTFGRCVLGLLKPDGGRILFEGEDMSDPAVMARIRREGAMQIIFQDPASALNPTWTVRGIIAEPLKVHGFTKTQVEERANELLGVLKMEPGDLDKMPYEFSGGQRQRIGIARAVACKPKFVFCDEPVSALDVSVRGQVMQLLREVQERLGLSYLFTAHDLGVVRHMSDRIGVMYLGRLVEIGDASDVFDHPAHPYTEALLEAIPEPDPTAAHHLESELIKGDLPSPLHVPCGCRYHPRCPYATAECREFEPALKEVVPGHEAACFHPRI